MKQGNGTCTVNGHFNGKISYAWGIVHCPCNYQRVYMLNFPMLIFIGQLEVFRRTHMSCAMVKLEGTHMEHGRPNIMNGMPKFMGLWKPFWMGEMTIRFWANTQKHQKPYVLTMSQISDAFPIRIYVEVPISPKPCTWILSIGTFGTKISIVKRTGDPCFASFANCGKKTLGGILQQEKGPVLQIPWSQNHPNIGLAWNSNHRPVPFFSKMFSSETSSRNSWKSKLNIDIDDWFKWPSCSSMSKKKKGIFPQRYGLTRCFRMWPERRYQVLDALWVGILEYFGYTHFSKHLKIQSTRW